MKTFRCAAVILATAVAALAQAPQGPLSLDDCIHLALNAPSSITAARRQEEIARYEVIQSRANFLPQALLANTFTYNNPNAEGISFVSLNGMREYSSLASADVDTTLQLADQRDEPVPLPDAQTPAAVPCRGRLEFRLLEAQRQGFAAEAGLALGPRPVAAADPRFKDAI